MMSLEQAIGHAEEVSNKCQNFVTAHKEDRELEFVQRTEKCAEEHRQLAAWLSILKKAKFEYDEAWRIITHPTPDVTYSDRDRAKIILDVFRDSLGRME